MNVGTECREKLGSAREAAMLVESIRHCAARLLTFSGRDSRAQFWPYAFTILALLFATMFAAMYRLMGQMARYAAEHPEQSSIDSGPGRVSVTIHGDAPELTSGFVTMFEQAGIVVGIAVLLLAAAIVRRLHDRGKSGLWALPPAFFLTVGLVMMPRVMGNAGAGQPPDMRLFFALFLNNIIYLATLFYLGYLLATEGPKGANRFGPDTAVETT